jgi:aminocarboxymuconate-semialdehyde decarboxylase
MYYDTILHTPGALRYLASMVQADRMVLGTDESFPPADRDPIGSLARAGFSAEEIRRIGEQNPRELFRRLK